MGAENLGVPRVSSHPLLRDPHPLLNVPLPCRNHVYRRQGKTVELEEVGPRFQLRRECPQRPHKCPQRPPHIPNDPQHVPNVPSPAYLIRLGTLEQGDAADVEWRWHPYTATAPKRRLLSAQ